ncbi:MAG: hypothetical protein JST63_05140 [Bacteroidetes bacterium]|nr:hypothetical protein [Bacteroidota bacterium]
MHPYIPHLVNDIEAAHRKDLPLVAKEEPEMTMEEHFKAIDQWVSGIDEHPFSHYCGLTTESFPPAQQLTDEEMNIIIAAFTKMMDSWNLSVDLPRHLPISFAYELMVGLLNRETVIADSGCYCFDFCTGYAPDCELKDYCPCLKITNCHFRLTV